jgi:SAM-dependent methyltransferase
MLRVTVPSPIHHGTVSAPGGLWTTINTPLDGGIQPRCGPTSTGWPGLSEDGWDHNAHYHAFLLGQLPTRCGQALDVGCGTGSFARLLAGRCDQVLGIDLSPRMVAVAIPAPQPSRPGREPPGRAREPAAAAAPQRPPG